MFFLFFLFFLFGKQKLSRKGKFPYDEKYYFLLDKLKFHETEKVRKALENKNIEPRIIVFANPWLNPTELLFNVIKIYTKS